GLAAVAKRYLLQGAARNLGLLMRELFGVGTARALQAGRAALGLRWGRLLAALRHVAPPSAPVGRGPTVRTSLSPGSLSRYLRRRIATNLTGCYRIPWGFPPQAARPFCCTP